ncbi:MAG: helix-turn-helix transcriptional regulator [Bacteroidota bacterium]
MSKIFDKVLANVSVDTKRFVDNSIQIADQIHSILESQGKSQKDLADLMGKSESEISKWLTGTHNFTLRSLSKIEAVLNAKIIITPHQSRRDLKMTGNAVEVKA